MTQLDIVSQIQNATRVGIMADGQGIFLIVGNSNFFAPSTPTVWAPNGVQVSRGATAWVIESTFDNFRSPTSSAEAGAGIRFLCPGVEPTALVLSNAVSNSNIGVSLVDSDGVEVSNNIIQDTEIGITMQSQGDPTCFSPLVPTQNSQENRRDLS